MKDKEYKEILEGIKSLLEGLPEGEEKEYIQEKYNSIKERYGEEELSGEFNMEEFNEEIASMTNILLENPNLAKEAEQEEDLLEKVNAFTNIIAGISDLSLANKQINESRAALENIDPPQKLRPFKRSDLLQNQIRTAMQDTSPQAISNRTAGLEADIASQYAKDLNNAAVSSAGQTGAYGSYSQLAARNRIRNAMQLQEARGLARDRTNRNLNYLAGLDIRENQAADVNARTRAEQDYRRFIDESKSAGALGRAGRINKRTARNQLLSTGMQRLIPAMVQARPDSSPIISDVDKAYMQGAIKSNPPTYNRYREPLFDMDGSDFDLFQFEDNLNSYRNYV